MTTLRIPKCMAVILHDWKSNLFTQCGLRLVSRDALTPSCSLPSASFLVGEPRAHPMQPFSSSLLHTLTTGTTTWKRLKNEYAETTGKRLGNDLETTSIYSMISHVSKAVPLLIIKHPNGFKMVPSGVTEAPPKRKKSKKACKAQGVNSRRPIFAIFEGILEAQSGPKSAPNGFKIDHKAIPKATSKAKRFRKRF